MRPETMLSQLDSSDASAVPSLCLQIAAYLSERGEPEAEGWRALGVFKRIPTQEKWGLWRYYWSIIDDRFSLHGRWLFATGDNGWETRSLALRAAAVAFAGLPDEVKREILNSGEVVV